MTDPTRHRWRFWVAGQARIAAWLAFAVRCPPVFGQDGPALAQSSAKPPISFGVEIALRSGHATRGFVISDRPVVQPVAWVSGRVAQFSLWGNFPLAETTDSSRPRILEMELTRAHSWGHLTITPAITMFFYHDPLHLDSDRSMEGWLYLSYDAGPIRLFTNHSLDVLTYRGAYFGEAGIASERHVSRQVEVGGSLGAGWASSRFNAEYADIARSALDRVSVEGWLTAHMTPHSYIGPHVEFSTIVNRSVRAELTRPTFVLIGLTTGVEF